MKLLPTCREVSRMVSDGLDRQLGPIDRVRLRLHLSVCDGCTHFNQQMRLIRDAMRRLGPGDDDRP
jgi:hypothetical protein